MRYNAEIVSSYNVFSKSLQEFMERYRNITLYCRINRMAAMLHVLCSTRP